MNRIFYYILQITWGFLQNLAGFLLFIYCNMKHRAAAKDPLRQGRTWFYKNAIVTNWNRTDSVALGMFIFFGHGESRDPERMLRHEYGHTLQSVILGPLYLPVIGLPSGVRAHRWDHHPMIRAKANANGKTYFDFYTESWADRLGGVSRADLK